MNKFTNTNRKQIRVAVVEDHTLVREALVLILKKEPQITVCFQAENGQELLNQLPNHEIDIILMDLDMPIMDGRETLFHLIKHHPQVKTILLSMHEDPWIVSELIKEGATSYLRKNCSFDELVDALFEVKFKGSHVSSLVKKSLELTSNEPNLMTEKSLVFQFSNREQLVLKLICDGKTSDQIAERMFLSKKSIDAIRSELLKIVGAKNTAELVRKSILLGVYKVRSDEEIEEETQKIEQAKKERKLNRLHSQTKSKK